jgi:hypothetical protein
LRKGVVPQRDIFASLASAAVELGTELAALVGLLALFKRRRWF